MSRKTAKDVADRRPQYCETTYMYRKVRILFLCTRNSCWSQMAEGWTQHLKGDLESYSAWVEPRDVDWKVAKPIAEVGIDISGQTSKDVETLGDLEFDYLITLCDQAYETYPFFPTKARVVHRGFDGPPKLAASVKNKEEGMVSYRRVRDGIKAFVEKLPEALMQGNEKDEVHVPRESALI